MDADYSAVDTGTPDLGEQLRQRIFAGLPIVSLLGQPKPMAAGMTGDSGVSPARPPSTAPTPPANTAPAVSLRQPEPGTLALGQKQAVLADEDGKLTGPPAVRLTESVASTGSGATPAGIGLTGEMGEGNAARLMEAARAATAARTQPRSGESELRDLLGTEPTRDQFPAAKLPLWKKALGAAAATAAGAVNPKLAGDAARDIFGAPKRRAEEQFDQAHQKWEGNVSNLLKALNARRQDLEDQNTQSEIDARTRGKTQADKPENLDREAFDYYVGQGMSPADARKRVLQDAQDVKGPRQTHTSPFEAFAYGDENERKAASDFLDLEHRLGRKYDRPNEFEERYRLFKEDPDTYRAMFGDKSGDKPDRATATRMLSYFDKRRREVQGDFTLDDEQKRQQLDEITNLERPFMEAVQPGATNVKGGDRVEVIHPDGRRGSIPRSQLNAAKKKGYREVQPQ